MKFVLRGFGIFPAVIVYVGVIQIHVIHQTFSAIIRNFIIM